VDKTAGFHPHLDLPLDQSLPYSLPDESSESFGIYLEDRYEYLYKRSSILSSMGYPSKGT
jgi:hypothetical protein